MQKLCAGEFCDDSSSLNPGCRAQGVVKKHMRRKIQKQKKQTHKASLYLCALCPTPCALRPVPYALTKGFTLVELLVVLLILSIIGIALSSFQTDIFALYGTTRDSLSVQQDVRQFLKTVVAELRSAQSSDLGGYPIETATATTLTFYSDIDGNGTRERTRYFVTGTTLQKGITSSSGAPAIYNLSAEKISDQVHYLISTTTPLFSYYGKGYVPTMSALTPLVDIKAIRLIRIRVGADVNPVRAPGIITGESEVSVRNLKDNL